MVKEIEEIDRGNMDRLQGIVWYLSYTRTSFLLRDEVINWYFISKNVIFIIVSLVGRTEGTTTHSIHHFVGWSLWWIGLAPATKKQLQGGGLKRESFSGLLPEVISPGLKCCVIDELLKGFLNILMMSLRVHRILQSQGGIFLAMGTFLINDLTLEGILIVVTQEESSIFACVQLMLIDGVPATSAKVCGRVIKRHIQWAPLSV